MILLNSDSSIINETLNLSQSTPVSRLEKVDLTFEDNSGGHFHLYCQGKKEMKLSIRLPAWNVIKKEKSLVDLIKKDYEGMWVDEVDEGFDVTISGDIEKLKLKSDNLVESFSNLKQKIISSPLKRILNSLTNNDNDNDNKYDQTPIVIPLSGKDFYAVTRNSDQIVILFGMNFEDQTDTILAKVFLQEFYDTRNNRLEDAPVVLYGKEPPKELKDVIKPPSMKTSDSLNYLTLVLFPRHYSSPQSRDHLQKTLPFLSDYLHYHLKCSKAYLHQRMRAKTQDFLKILNRAKPENF